LHRYKTFVKESGGKDIPRNQEVKRLFKILEEDNVARNKFTKEQLFNKFALRVYLDHMYPKAS